MYQAPQTYVPFSPTAAQYFPPYTPYPQYNSAYQRYEAAWRDPGRWAPYEDRRSGFSFSSLFGGGSKSKTEQTINTKSAAELITRNIMNCSGSQAVSQAVTVSGNYNVVRVKQVSFMKLSAECVQNVQTVADIQTQITNDIMAQVKSQSQALLGALGRSDSEINTKISQDVKNTVTAESVQNIVNSVNMSQEVLVTGDNNIVEVTQEQVADLVTRASQDLLNSMTSVQELNSAVKSTAEATQTNPISEIIGTVFDGVAEIAWIWGIVIIVAIIFLGREIIKGGVITELFGKNKGQRPAEPNTNPTEPSTNPNPPSDTGDKK